MSEMHKEIWLHRWSETVLYVATEGEDSPEITNHLSDVRFNIVMGSGYIATVKYPIF